MTNQEIQEMLEESWYWSTIEDMLVIFAEHGKEKVLRDAANLLLEREAQKQQKSTEQEWLLLSLCLS